jgi:hypothetical protein
MDTPVSGTPRALLRVEALAVLLASVTGYYAIDASWMLFAALILLPDLGLSAISRAHGSALSPTTRSTRTSVPPSWRFWHMSTSPPARGRFASPGLRTSAWIVRWGLG